MVKKIVKNHPLAVRWFHWINFPILGVMIWSGLLIYWANDVYRLGWGDKTVLKFFPDSFYKVLDIPFHLADGMALHFVFMWFFAINGILYVLYTVFSGEWRYLVPGRKSFKEAWQVLLHDLHISKYEPPKTRYNSAQKIAYTMIIIMGLGSLLTGLSIYKPVRFGYITALLGGYAWARAEHFMLTIGYVLFFVIHIGQVIKTGWNNFQGMVTGFEVQKVNVHAMAVVSMDAEVIPYSIPANEGVGVANEESSHSAPVMEAEETVKEDVVDATPVKATDEVVTEDIHEAVADTKTEETISVDNADATPANATDDVVIEGIPEAVPDTKTDDAISTGDTAGAAPDDNADDDADDADEKKI